jgi:spore germination protein YaaH
MFKSLACLSCCLILSLNYSYSEVKNDKNIFHYKDNSLFQDSTNTAKPKANPLKSLLDALKFKKNAITKEQQRVKQLIEKIIQKDTSLVTVKYLEDFKRELAESNKEQFQTLLDLIKELKISENSQLSEASDSIPPGNRPFKLKKEPDPNDKYINDLVDKLIPILTNNKEEQEKKKSLQEQLKLMRDVYARKGAFIDTINDSTLLKYRLKLGHRAEVLGIYPFDTKNIPGKYNLSTLSTLIYDLYEIDPSTGLSKNFNRWKDATIINNVKDAGAKVILTVSNKNSLETAKFLTNETARKNLITNTIDLLEQRDADGINISLTGLNKKLRPLFVDFISALSTAYRLKSKQFQIIITLPIYDEYNAYDIPALDALTDRFIIDFSKKPNNFPGPISPLSNDSDYSIQSSVSRYLNVGIPPYKFILGLTYYGAEFERNSRTGVEIFKTYIPYNQIRLNHQYAPVSYNKDQAFASIETRDDEGNLTGHIYYDNESSLEQKYDFVIQNGLGGVAIRDLGADEGYGELWDVLASKFIRIDTVAKELLPLTPSKTKDLSLWGYIKTNSIAYYKALQFPCDEQYDNPDELLLTIVNIFLGLLSLLIMIILIYQIKDKGEKWKWKKLLIKILIVSINLFIITIFMWLYIDDRFPWFGSGENCISMPFLVLLMIIFVGILFGSLIMRLLIFPAIQHDEKP